MSVVALERIVNVATVPHRSPFRYPGGKTWLVPQVRKWITSVGRRPRVFLEPFAGGGIVGLTVAFEKLADQVVLVELDAAVAAVWEAMLNGEAKRLADRVRKFVFSEETVKSLLAADMNNSEDIAFATLVRNRIQHGGILAPGASFMKKGENGRGIASRWYPQTLAKRIMSIWEIKDRIEFRHADGFAVTEENRRLKNAVFFIDPPYTVAGKRLYRHSEIDHEKLFKLAANLTGDFLMTYDDTPEIRKLAQKFRFDMETVAMKSRLHSQKKELLIGPDLDWARR